MRALLGVLAAALVAGCGTSGVEKPSPQAESPVPAMIAKLPPGYLPRGATPSSLSLIPPPPAPGSAALARDEEAARAALALRDGPRWRLAIQDADLRSPAAAATFACAVGVEISPVSTPRLYGLLSKTLIDIGLSPYPTKNKYQRARPFVLNGAPMCTPDEAALLRRDGSYPSGHSAIGWGWALILAEAAPDRTDAILARGRAFGQSRVVCNVHWLSDTEEGRMIAAGTVARLHDEPAFRADLEAAKAEISAARAAGRTPNRDCAAEAAQLAAG
jgi:acid phosphatase (class A)